jgi:hypothetical protein
MTTHIHCSLRAFPITARSGALTAVPICRESGPTHFNEIHCIQQTALKNLLKTFSFFSQSRVSYNNCIVQLSKILLDFTSDATGSA